MGYGYGLGDIGKAFVAIALLVGMIEVVTRAVVYILEISPWPKKNSFHWTLSYWLSCGLSSWICWQGHFDIFLLLGLNWWGHHWLGWVLTGSLIGGGAKRLLEYFKLIRAIPGSLTGNNVYGGLDGGFEATPSSSESSGSPELPENNQKGED